MAGDFNHIHDEDSKRFCVPGDLLFAVLLSKEGISQKMRFEFSGMVGDGIALSIDKKCEKWLTKIKSFDQIYVKAESIES